ncbi:MAG TPA: CARDB domain-containing protein [Candidatus Binatia bacterium]|nr:CARDB domain-containing protein [Candidatus Binatia bacterium]
MKHALFVTRRLLLAVCCELALAGSGAAAATSTPARSAAIAAAYRGVPIYFEANRGQADPHVRFLSRGAGHQLFLTPDEAVLSVRRRPAAGVRGAQGLDGRPRRPVPASQPVVLRMRLVGANREPRLSGLDEIPATVNYFTGRDPQRWCTGVPAYGKVKYEAVYPGIDLVYHGDQGTLEYDLLVSPGADPGRITLAFEGARSLALDRDGDLVLETAAGVAGVTSSFDFPTTANAPQPDHAGGTDVEFPTDAFVVKISPTGAGLSGAWKLVTHQCGHRDGRGCEVHGVFGVHNPGTQTAAASVIRFFLSADDTLDEGDRLLKEALLRPLRAGRTRSKTVRAKLDASVGDQFLIAVLAATNIVPEANESNNVVVSPAIARGTSNDRD